MSFSSFFSEQARRPRGWFGRMIMPLVFDKGNAFLNRLVSDLMAVRPDDRIIEIGFGTGKLLKQTARSIDNGFIEGIDLSSTMVSIAQKRNKTDIAAGKVRIRKGDFDAAPYESAAFTKVYSVNTLYFWQAPEHTAAKIAGLLRPEGQLFLAFEDIAQLQKRKLNDDVFRLYSIDDVKELLIKAGFSKEVRVISRKRGSSIYHCVVAIK